MKDVTNPDLPENILASKIIPICIEVHRILGPGLFESVYEEALAFEFEQAGIKFKRQEPISVPYKTTVLGVAFIADFIIEDKLILELKSIEAIGPVQKKQVGSYLKLTKLRLGLLINFNEVLLKDGLKRIANNLN